MAALVAAGVAHERIAVDPGIGFGKTFAHNLTLIRHLGDLRALGRPVVIGLSRKGLIGTITGRDVADRDAGSIAAAARRRRAGRPDPAGSRRTRHLRCSWRCGARSATTPEPAALTVVLSRGDRRCGRRPDADRGPDERGAPPATDPSRTGAPAGGPAAGGRRRAAA